MIEFIQGKIEELTPTQAVLLTQGGVAYDLNISLYTYSAIQGKDDTRLYVYEAIREDAYILYGFSAKQERELFLMLISVPGIGGASARMILSSFSPSELIGIISSGNDSLLKKVKGIGAKTAQRIIVDLHDRQDRLPPRPSQPWLPWDSRRPHHRRWYRPYSRSRRASLSKPSSAKL